MNIIEIRTITDALSIVPFETKQKDTESKYSMPVKERLEWINSIMNGFNFLVGTEFRFFAGMEEGKVTCYAICLFVGSKIKSFNRVTIYRIYGEDEEVKELLDKITERAKELNIKTISIERDIDAPKEQVEKMGFNQATVIYEKKIK